VASQARIFGAYLRGEKMDRVIWLQIAALMAPTDQQLVLNGLVLHHQAIQQSASAGGPVEG